ncbi:MAG: CDP-archaeol synthase [Candidatus Nomurabacteria bacterium]|nr:CDP-archaeol synthase [Candidatus Nomurabacteria bacterium]
MIPLTINNFLIYFSIAWGTNICLNFLYVIKRYVPSVKKLDIPLDGDIEFNGERLLGESTTVLGLLISILASLFVYSIIHNLVWMSIPILVYFGHLFGSFVKRRIHKKGGEFMLFVDHGDYMILTGIVFVILNYISFLFAFLALLVTYILHPIACFLAFKLKLRENPY